MLLPKASDAAPADDWGGLGGWALALGGEGGRAKDADVDPGGVGMDAAPLLLLDISPVAVSAEYQNSHQHPLLALNISMGIAAS